MEPSLMDAVSPTKARILEAAAGLFATHGYHATGVAQISEKVGIGRGALYHHIKSKENLLFQILWSAIDDLIADAHTIAVSEIPVVEKLRGLSRALLRYNATHLSVATTFIREAGALTGQNRRLVFDRRDEYEALWASLFQDGARNGELRALDPIVIKGILGMYNYSYTWIRLHGRLTVDEIADLFLDAILNDLTVSS